MQQWERLRRANNKENAEARRQINEVKAQGCFTGKLTGDDLARLQREHVRQNGASPYRVEPTDVRRSQPIFTTRRV